MISDNAASRLAKALTEARAPSAMIAAAYDGFYGDFTSPLATPISQLVADLDYCGLNELAQRAMRGEFDGR